MYAGLDAKCAPWSVTEDASTHFLGAQASCTLSKANKVGDEKCTF